MGESLGTVVAGVTQVFVAFRQAWSRAPAVVDCIVWIVAVRRADPQFSPLTRRILLLIVICFRFELQARAGVVKAVAIAPVNGYVVAGSPGLPVDVASVLRVRVVLHLDGLHGRHQMPVVAFCVVALALHQVYAESVRICRELDVLVELGDEDLVASTVVTVRRIPIGPSVLTGPVQAVRGDAALAPSQRTRVLLQRPASPHTSMQTFVSRHGGLAVVEGLLLVKVAVRVVFVIVFADGIPGSVVASLVSPHTGTGEEDGVGSVTHPSV